MKRFILLFSLLVLSSCIENPDNLRGYYVNGYEYAKITKAGNDGYFVVVGNYSYSDSYENTFYCEYKNGCFVTNKKKEDITIICRTDNNTMNYQGVILKKKIKK